MFLLVLIIGSCITVLEHMVIHFGIEEAQPLLVYWILLLIPGILCASSTGSSLKPSYHGSCLYKNNSYSRVRLFSSPRNQQRSFSLSKLLHLSSNLHSLYSLHYCRPIVRHVSSISPSFLGGHWPTCCFSRGYCKGRW